MAFPEYGAYSPYSFQQSTGALCVCALHTAVFCCLLETRHSERTMWWSNMIADYLRFIAWKMCKNASPNRRRHPCGCVWVVQESGFPSPSHTKINPFSDKLVALNFSIQLITKQTCSVVIITHLNIVFFLSSLGAARRHEIWIKNGVRLKWHDIPHNSTKSISSIFVCVRRRSAITRRHASIADRAPLPS